MNRGSAPGQEKRWEGQANLSTKAEGGILLEDFHPASTVIVRSPGPDPYLEPDQDPDSTLTSTLVEEMEGEVGGAGTESPS